MAREVRHGALIAVLLTSLASCGLDPSGTSTDPSDASTGGLGGAAGVAATGGSWTTGGSSGAAGSGGVGGVGGGSAGATAGGGTGAVAGAGSGGVGATGGTGSGEDCSNGKDDDSDSKTDCQDEDCGAFACEPDPPGGWTGPVAFYLGAAPAPDCAAAGGWGTESAAGGELTVPGLTCQTCACSIGTAACPAPTVKTYENTGCGTELASVSGTGCHQMDGPGSATQKSAKLQVGAASGDCTAVETTPASQPAPYYSSAARACGGAAAGTGCGGGGACLPKPVGGFTEICIYKNGAVACPSGDYSVAHQIVTAFTDERKCSACACAKPTCAVQAVITDDVCSGAVFTTLNANNQCSDLGSSENTIGANITAVAGCSPTGAAQSGNVNQTQITLCCKAP